MPYADREAARACMARNHAKNKARDNAAAAAWRAANPVRASELNSAWVAANRERNNAQKGAWARANPEVGRAKNAARRAAKLQRTVQWDCELTELVMSEAHDLAHRRAGNWHVDHKIPLQGKTVSGLHVWNNVQVIPASVNCSKSNNFKGG